jgi:hypothetical protein
MSRMVLDASGCQFLTISKSDVRVTNQTFIALVEHVIDIPCLMQVFVRRGKANARTLTRARVLLKCDEGWTNAAICEALVVSEQTIGNLRQRKALAASGRSACWAMQTSRHTPQQSNTDQQISFRNR